MKKCLALIAGAALIGAFGVANAAPLMPNATVINNVKTLTDDNVSTGLVLNQGADSDAIIYLSKAIMDSDFPEILATKSAQTYAVNLTPGGGWSDSIYYGDSKTTAGSNGCYFQFNLDKYNELSVASAVQGNAGCFYTGTTLIVNIHKNS